MPPQLPSGLAGCRDEVAPFSVRDAITSLRSGLHPVTNECCFTQLSPRLIKIRQREKLLSAVRFCEAPVSAPLRFSPRNGRVLGWRVLETCGTKLPQRSFSQSQITSPNQSHPPLGTTYQSVEENSLLQIQHAWRPDLVTRLRKSHTQQACKTRHEHKTTSCLLSGCGFHLLACVPICFSTHFIQLFTRDAFPIKWNGLHGSHAQNTVKDTSQTWSPHERFLVMAFDKRLQNSAVCHLSTCL